MEQAISRFRALRARTVPFDKLPSNGRQGIAVQSPGICGAFFVRLCGEVRKPLKNRLHGSSRRCAFPASPIRGLLRNQ
jgi:hypothetical protein